MPPLSFRQGLLAYFSRRIRPGIGPGFARGAADWQWAWLFAFWLAPTEGIALALLFFLGHGRLPHDGRAAAIAGLAAVYAWLLAEKSAVRYAVVLPLDLTRRGEQFAWTAAGILTIAAGGLLLLTTPLSIASLPPVLGTALGLIGVGRAALKQART